MTVSSYLSDQTFDGDGISTDFIYSDRIDSPSDVKCFIIEGSGLERIPTFTVTGDENGATVSITSGAPAVGEKVVLYRDTPPLQLVNYEAGDFPSATHERNADKLIMIVQEVKEQLLRTFRFRRGSEEMPEVTPFSRAGAVVVSTEDGGFGEGPTIAELGVEGGGGTTASVSQNAEVVHLGPRDLNFTGGVEVTDDGDETVTVNVTASGGASISQDGTPVLAAPTDINFVDMEVTDDGDGTASVSIPAIGTGPVVRARRPMADKTGETHMLAVAEEGYALHLNATVDQTLTVPTDAMAPVPVGAEFEVVRLGTGAVSLQADTGVTLNGVLNGVTNVSFQYGAAVLRKIAVNTWLVIGSIAAVATAAELTTYLWSDIFTDHTATLVYADNDPGLDWTGFGTTDAQPADQAMEWFMNNVLPIEAPNGAILDLNSPNGDFYVKGRLQVPPRSVASNITIDLTGQNILRGYDGDENRWGQFFLWGLKASDPAITSAAVVDVDATAGQNYVILRDDADTTALMNTAAYGSIIEIRTDMTSPNYHPDSSRATMFVSSVDPVTRTVTFTQPLPIDVPRDNPVSSSFETSDPSTLTMLQGGLLTANSGAGSNTIMMGSTAGLQPGDWLEIGTTEDSSLGGNQWNDGVEPNYEPDVPDHNTDTSTSNSQVQINLEMHRILSISGNQVTLEGTLGKNKLTAWEAYAIKIDPIEGFTLRGGSMFGDQSGSPAAWDHQYVWARYIVNSSVRDMEFDRNTAIPYQSGLRRTGQAVRFDQGDNNFMDTLTIGAPQTISAGEGYGVSMRLGCRNTMVLNSFFEGCRHAIEFWASSGGCRAYQNRIENGTSSCIDTHGNWNTGITIEENYITRTQAGAEALHGGVGSSGDIDGEPDAIRIGNNKFTFDRDITVINNTVENYEGSAFSVVPGVIDVTLDGMTVTNVYRVFHFHRPSGSRTPTNPVAPAYDLIVRNVTANGWKDVGCHMYDNDSATTVGDYHLVRVLIEDCDFGEVLGADAANAYEADGDIKGFYFTGAKDLTLRNITMYTNPCTNNQYALYFGNIENLVLDNVVVHTCQRGVQFRDDIVNASGAFTIRDVLDQYLYTCEPDALLNSSGLLTLHHNQTFVGTSTPANSNEVRTFANTNTGGLTLTLDQVA